MTRASRNSTKYEVVRDSILFAVKHFSDVIFRLQNCVNDKPKLHPLSRLIASRVGDPLKHWNVSDLAQFRSDFNELLGYLPSRISCEVYEATESTSAGIPMKIRHYLPSKPRNDMAVVFLHGGGFVLGGPATNDPECDYIASNTTLEVISVGYPLAPEYRYPKALDALSEVIEKISSSRSIVLCGESAGGNLALALVQQNETIRQRCAGLVLAYPFLDLSLTGRTIQQFADGYVITRELLAWFVENYLGGETSPSDPHVSPLFDRLDNLPPSLTLVGEFDPLRSDAERFSAGNNNSELEIFPGMIHGFLQFRGLCSSREIALQRISRFIRSLELPENSSHTTNKGS